MIRTPAGWLEAIPLSTGTPRAHVETDTPLWHSVTARNFYGVLGMLLAPLALAAFAFAAWALTSQMHWTSAFLFTDGPLADWIVWTALALGLQFCASTLNRLSQRS